MSQVEDTRSCFSLCKSLFLENVPDVLDIWQTRRDIQRWTCQTVLKTRCKIQHLPFEIMILLMVDDQRLCQFCLTHQSPSHTVIFHWGSAVNADQSVTDAQVKSCCRVVYHLSSGLQMCWDSDSILSPSWLWPSHFFLYRKDKQDIFRPLSPARTHKWNMALLSNLRRRWMRPVQPHWFSPQTVIWLGVTLAQRHY